MFAIFFETNKNKPKIIHENEDSNHLYPLNHASFQFIRSHEILLQKSTILEAETIVFVLTAIINSISWLTLSTKRNCIFSQTVLSNVFLKVLLVK